MGAEKRAAEAGSGQGEELRRRSEHEGKRVGACPITQRSIVQLQRELYVAFALRAIDETELETKPYVGRIQNGSVRNIEELSPELQPLRFTQRKFLLNA